MHSILLLAFAALPLLPAHALKVSTTARCGTQSWNTLTCKNSAFGNCCSKSGHCGSTSAYCGAGCQTGFGDCTSSVTSVRVSSTSTRSSSRSSVRTSSVSSVRTSSVSSVRTSSSSARTSSTTTPAARTSTSSPITSSSSIASSSRVSSSSRSSTVSSAPAASSSVVAPGKVSTDGSCGGTQGYSCLGSTFGNCCSSYGWCGSSSTYCGTGCNAAFGSCDGASSIRASQSSTQASSTLVQTTSTLVTSTSTSSPAPSSTSAAQQVSNNGQCGPSFGGMTCLGSTYGDCCSEYSWCGATNVHCATGCQKGFGKCNADTASISSVSAPSSTSTVPAPTRTCGVEGFANNADYYASSFNLVDATDVETCVALCLAEAACASYLFNPGLGNCAYLPWSLAEGDFIATTGTNQLFWERACADV